MNEAGFSKPINLDADELRGWVESHNEKDYLIIDVRQPQEYRHGHIPGAMFIPLLELESQLFGLPTDRDLIFYCSNGGRSLAAATLVIDAEISERRIYNLAGGILGWYGRTLSGFPRLKVLEDSENIDALLYTLMNLEKGAWRFYDALAGRFAAEPCAASFERLRQAETAHAATVYALWASRAESPPAFDRLFEDLSGDILEGGESLAEVLPGGSAQDSEGACLDIIELSLLIEHRAFELYRIAAERSADDGVRDILLDLAQAEKTHMRVLTQAIETCTEPSLRLID